MNAITLPESEIALSASVNAYLKESKSAATLKAYRSDWVAFVSWCESAGLVALPASPETVASYVAFLADSGAKPSTVSRKVASLSIAHRSAGLESPCRSELVRSTLQGVRRVHGVAVTKKAPVRIQNIRAAMDTLDASPSNVRDRALVLLGYAGAFRRSELVALNIGDVERTAEGLIVTLRRSKTDQEGHGHRKGIPYGSNPATCPVRALMAWIELLGASEGPLFRRVLKNGRILGESLSDKAVALVVKRLAVAMGLDPDSVGGHSLRAGMVTDSYAVGAPEAAIMATTGHRSHSVMAGYRREGNLFRQNAPSMLGL